MKRVLKMIYLVVLLSVTLRWIENLQRKAALRRCLIIAPDTSIETFETDGKRYDRKKYLEWRIGMLLTGYSKRGLKKRLEERMEIGKLASEETLIEIDALNQVLARD